MDPAQSLCDHRYAFLRSTKWCDGDGGYNIKFCRVDTFFCEKCLHCREVQKQDYSRDTPPWYRGD